MRKSLYLLFTLFIILVLAACNSEEQNNSGNAISSGEVESELITVNHELGTAVVEKKPEKVVVFDFGILDTLDYLNIDVVGVPKTNVPSYLDKYTDDDYENVGSLKEPDFEKISQINPDLIIISGRQAELYDELSKLAPVIYVGINYDNYIDSFKQNIQLIGQIFDKEDEINNVIAEIDEKISEIKDNVKTLNKNALILLANENKISAYGQASRFGIIHDVFGIEAVDKNIEQSTHGMNVTFEYVLEQNPDILYVIDRSAAVGEEASAKHIVENEIIAKTNAMKNDEIYYLDPEVWYLSGGGIISLQIMIDQISESIK